MKKTTFKAMALVMLFLFSALSAIAQTYCTQDIKYPAGSGVRVFKSLTTSGFVTDYTNVFINDGSIMPAKEYNQVLYNGSNLALEAHPGNNVSLNFSISMGWTDLILYVDYNGDKDFTDSGEQVKYFLGSGSSSPQSSFTFTIPADAKLGDTRIRVKSGWLRGEDGNLNPSSPELDPCFMATTAGDGVTTIPGMVVDIDLKISNVGTGTKNPLEDVVNVFSDKDALTVHAPLKSKCDVFSLTGSLVSSFVLKSDKHKMFAKPGVYIVKITTPEGIISKKIVVPAAR